MTHPDDSTSGEMTQLLALGSRITNKVPQDAAAVVIDQRTGNRAYVVADGVSHSRGEPGQVRRFASLTASVLAKHLVRNAARIAAAQEGPPGGTPGTARPPADGFVRRVLALGLAASPGRQLPECACVVGGLLFLPNPRTAVLFALGNVTVLARIRSAIAPQDPYLAALSGTPENQLLSQDEVAVISSQIEAHVVAVPHGAVELIALSDGAFAPTSAGFYRGPTSGLEALGAEPTLAGWLQHTVYLLDRQGPDCALSMLSDNPADDATVVTAVWSAAHAHDDER